VHERGPANETPRTSRGAQLWLLLQAKSKPECSLQWTFEHLTSERSSRVEHRQVPTAAPKLGSSITDTGTGKSPRCHAR